ncbi:MAG: hypothetical protein QOI24_1365 [Acidobacteriota bacterium]|jgi:hypothetical protein|nr:hypothetical protein [Acidobacteriota bacterium]
MTLFKREMQTPDKLMTLGMFCLAMGGFARMFHPATPFAENLLDGASGMGIGMSIAFNLLAARMRGKMRRDGQPPACA